MLGSTLKTILLIKTTMYNCLPLRLNPCSSYTLRIFHFLFLLLSCITMRLCHTAAIYTQMYPGSLRSKLDAHLEDDRHFIGMEKRLWYRGEEGKRHKIMYLLVSFVYVCMNFAIPLCNPTQNHTVCPLEHASIQLRMFLFWDNLKNSTPMTNWIGFFFW